MAARAPSLRRHFGRWLGAGTLALLLAGAALQWSQLYAQLAWAQDQRLLAAARAAETAPLWRLELASGERLDGDASLTPHPRPDELRPGDAPRLYITHAEGRLLRAAALLRERPGESPAVLQVAEPLDLRLPAWRQLATGWFGPFGAGVVLMAGIAAAAAFRARRWVMRVLREFESNHRVMTPPTELAPTLARVATLQEEQSRWLQEQQRFLADAAHQLRTPMAVLRAQLQGAMASAENPHALLAQMLHTVDRATGTANQLLSLTRVQQLKGSGALQPIGVGDAVRDAVVELSPLLADKRLDFALDGEGFEAPADAVMLGELLRNLLANAIHHSPRGSRIGVVLRRAPQREVVVWDEGAGIDDTVKPRLFTPFSAGRGGVGLGLSICQQIAQAMGAQVRLHNRVEAGRTVGVDAVVAWEPEA
jgi:two-component system sensor histidine kinase TctE